MDDMAAARCELTLRDAVSFSLLELIRTRFDHVSTPGADGTVLAVDEVDQAAVRALLILLWDAGHEVLSLKAG